MSVDADHQWKFYTIKVGKPVGSCGETDGKAISAESNNKLQVASDGKTPFPGGIFKLNIEDEACTHRCDGTNPGRLFCPQRETTCREDYNKNREVGWMKCGSIQFFAPSVYCDFLGSRGVFYYSMFVTRSSIFEYAWWNYYRHKDTTKLYRTVVYIA
jgi:hypothetical protein